VITVQKITTTKPVVLVAGGAGFIGSFLCEALLLQNCRVISVDNLSTGRKENLKRCLSNQNFVFIQHDLTKSLPPQLSGEEISYIFDLVGLKDVTQNLCWLAQKTGAKLLIVSPPNFSWEIFEKDFSKIDFRIVHLADVYGPRMAAGKIPNEKSLFITDAIFGITKAMFAPGTAGKTFYLTKEGEEKLKWKPQVSFEKEVKHIFSSAKAKRRDFRFLIFPLILFLFALFIPFVFFGFNGFLGVKYVQEAKNLFLAADFKKAKIKAHQAEIFLKRAEKLGRTFILGKQLAQGLSQAGLVADKAEVLGSCIFQNCPGDVQKLISEIKIGLDQSYFYFSLVEGELKSSTLINQQELNKKLPQLTDLMIKSKKGMEILPWLIGQDKKRTYLVLLQNNNELRPTGGFIGSFALVTFEKGKLLDFEVQDVYWADGQLKGHVEPPGDLKKYLGEASWYLRDSNWDPDFPVSALKAQWFLEKETGRVVDGVVGVNLFVAQRLLEAAGEVELPDYKEKINATNLFERAQYYSEIGFFPGSTQKQDFLGSLSRILFEKIKNAEGKTKIEIAKAIYQSLKSKDILVYLNDSRSMEVISELGWDGSVKNLKSQISNFKSFEDYLFIVEANVGVNKANYFVKRELDHKVDVSEDGQIRENLKITYQNDSPSENFPGGKYKNYLRILVPSESKLEKVLIDGRQLSEEKIDVRQGASKISFGFLVEVPVKEEVVVEVFYHLGKKIEIGEKTQYLFLVQKQSGIKEEKFNFRLSVPPEVAVFPVKPEAIAEGNTYFFNPYFNQDIVFEIFLLR